MNLESVLLFAANAAGPLLVLAAAGLRSRRPLPVALLPVLLVPSLLLLACVPGQAGAALASGVACLWLCRRSRGGGAAAAGRRVDAPERLRLAVEATGMGLWDTPLPAELLGWDDRLRQLWGYPPGEPTTLGMVLDRIHPEDLPRVQQAMASSVDPAGGGLLEVEHRVCIPGAGERWVRVWGRTLFEGVGVERRAVHSIGAMLDVTAQKQSEARVRLSESRLQAFMTHMPIAAWVVDAEARGVYASPGVGRLMDMPPERFLGRTSRDFFPEEIAERHFRHNRWVLEHQRPLVEEEGFLHPDGSVGLAHVVKFPMRGPAGEPQIGGVAIDITQRIRAEELVRASLEEKSVLLREIHHRVKNNLQIVSTLLDLQSEHSRDPAVLEMFRESRSRVHSMALIHERLYRSTDLARIDFSEYVRTLAGDLFGSYLVRLQNVELEVEVDHPPLPIDTAIPCGLLLNELISNCLKHAFAETAAGGDGGRVRVALCQHGGETHLTVSDNGVGFTPPPQGTGGTFGMQLIDTLVEQLGGTLAYEVRGGTTVSIRFPHLSAMGESA